MEEGLWQRLGHGVQPLSHKVLILVVMEGVSDTLNILP